jgi:hypothetical protein
MREIAAGCALRGFYVIGPGHHADAGDPFTMGMNQEPAVVEQKKR